MKQAFQRFRRLLDHQGYLIVTAACVAVIIGSAVWTGRVQPSAAPSPTRSAASQSAAKSLEQSLSEAQSVPSPTPRRFSPPLEKMAVIQPFSSAQLRPSGISGVWRVHDAVDLQAEAGASVRAIAEGEVITAGESGTLGASMVIDHGDGLIAAYAGLDTLSALSAGDTVREGEILGTLGAGPMDERDLGTHLHLRVTRNGQAIDPLSLPGVFSQER